MKFSALLKSIRCCQICGVFGATSGVCNFCIRQIRPLLPEKLFSRCQEGLSSKSLFIWDDLEDRWMRSVVHSQKGVGDPSRWKQWASWYIDRILFEEACGELPSYLIVPPSRNFNGIDHASGWAQALANQIGATVVSPFKLEGNSEQKRLSLASRDMKRFALKDGIETDVLKMHKFVFVDDVITSGATGKAAYQALGCPEGFMIWTLFDRPKLYGLRDGSASANFRA